MSAQIFVLYNAHLLNKACPYYDVDPAGKRAVHFKPRLVTGHQLTTTEEEEVLFYDSKILS